MLTWFKQQNSFVFVFVTLCAVGHLLCSAGPARCEEVPSDWLAQVQQGIADQEYHISWQDVLFLLWPFDRIIWDITKITLTSGRHEWHTLDSG